MACDMDQDGRFLAGLSGWARAPGALSFQTLGGLLAEEGFFEKTPSEAELFEALRARLGVEARAARRVFSAPYFRGLLARGAPSLAEAMLGGAGEGRSRSIRFEPLLEVEGGWTRERRGAQRDRRAPKPAASEARLMRSGLDEAGAAGGLGGAREWEHGSGRVGGRWFWAAWSEGALMALAPLGGDPASPESRSRASKRAERLRMKLRSALGDGREMGAAEARSKIGGAMAAGLGGREPLRLAPLGPPAWAAVWERLAVTPEGRSIGAADLARGSGLGKRVDLAREACDENPIAMLIPCHRLARGASSEGAAERWQDDARALLLLREFLKRRV